MSDVGESREVLLNTVRDLVRRVERLESVAADHGAKQSPFMPENIDTGMLPPRKANRPKKSR